MQNEELKGKILKVIKEYPVGSLATIKDGKPWVRYMMMQVHEGSSIYSTTFTASRKMAQIKENNNVHIAFGADPKSMMIPFVNVEGTAEILTDPETKKKCWHDMLSEFFKGPDDPDYSVIKVTPRIMEYWKHGAGKPEVYSA